MLTMVGAALTIDDSDDIDKIETDDAGKTESKKDNSELAPNWKDEEDGAMNEFDDLDLVDSMVITIPFVLSPTQLSHDDSVTSSTLILTAMATSAFVFEFVNRGADLNMLLEDILHCKAKVVVHDKLTLLQSTLYHEKILWLSESSLGEPPDIFSFHFLPFKASHPWVILFLCLTLVRNFVGLIA